MKGLKDKVVIVTGGATRVGAGVVEVLMGYGARVAVFDIDAAGGQKAVGNDAAKAKFWEVDITSDQSLNAAIEQVKAHFGRVDGLVNLACSYLDEGMASSREDWLKALDINLVSAVQAAKAVRPLLPRGGSIARETSAASVDLPEPVRPTRATVLPAGTRRSMPCNAKVPSA